MKKLKRTTSHRFSLLNGLACSLFRYGKIKTTLPKAKDLSRWAQKMVSWTKKDNLAMKRKLFAHLKDKKVVAKICKEYLPRWEKRNGGYMRVTRIGRRLGDGAQMAVIELVE